MEFKEFEKIYRKKKEKQDIELSISKAQTSMQELFLKIEEKKYEIARIENHINLQKKVIKELQEKHRQIGGSK